MSWPSGSQSGADAKGVSLRWLIRVREGEDAFAFTPLAWSKQQVELRLPLSAGGVLFNEFGMGQGCVVTARGQDLGGPMGREVSIDARTGWSFELRDLTSGAAVMNF